MHESVKDMDEDSLGGPSIIMQRDLHGGSDARDELEHGRDSGYLLAVEAWIRTEKTEQEQTSICCQPQYDSPRASTPR
jgi:hypothetical protein